VSGLESLAYAVLEAKTGPAAITLLESGEPIALVFSDIVMPGGMTGYDVAERIRSMKPDLKILLTSGYIDLGVKAGQAARDVTVLRKPYTRAQLACALREALDGQLLPNGKPRALSAAGSAQRFRSPINSLGLGSEPNLQLGRWGLVGRSRLPAPARTA
jgi:CheY-like chemotaxis protein